MDFTKYMRADTRLIIDGTPELSPLLGNWTNTNPETDHIRSLSTGRREDGTFTVHIYGTDSTDLIDWGEVEARPVVIGTSMEGVGFHAFYDFGAAETLIAANHSKGVLVIQTYTTFKDSSGRPNYFSREFFHQ